MPPDNPPEDLIRYDVMVQDALLGVVRKVLVDAARNGLPGEHHFYITFRSHAPGVRLSTRLRQKHPEEMTIVLQHQFWDLQVTDHALEVGLSFGGVPERLLVPFESMTGFYDPSVQFGLKFAADEAQPDNDVIDDDTPNVKDRLDAIATHEKSQKAKEKSKAGPKLAPAPAGGEGDAAPQNAPARKPRNPRPKSVPTVGADAPASDSPPAVPAPGGSAEVVSLEAFRKKK